MQTQIDTTVLGRTLILTRSLEWLMRIGYALLPLTAIAYLYFFVDPTLRYVDYGVHEIAIGIAIALSALLSYVTWRCYRESGEPLLRWVALGLTGFTVVYLPHGVLTRAADCSMPLFLLFGPTSRLVMVACLFIGLLRYDAPHDVDPVAGSRRALRRGFALFLAIDALVATVALSPLATQPWLRLTIEGSAALLATAAVGLLLWRRFGSPLLRTYAVAMAAMAQSCLSFLLAAPWSHQWWLGHGVFAIGFFLLSYGVLRAFHTTRAFSTVYGEEEMMRRLEQANQELERLAATDPLTGAANRRHFLRRLDEELARARRESTGLALLVIDVDHFKRVNDRHGHPAGDAVLVAFVQRLRDSVRPQDLVGRVGGEEFMALLPGATADGAALVAERIRAAMDSWPVLHDEYSLHVTVSIGIADTRHDGDDVTALIRAADERLYKAKEAGRNRVIQ